MAPWPVNLPTNFELHLGQRPTPSPLIKCPVDTKTVGKEGRTLRGPSVSSDHLPRSGCHQLCCNRLMAEEGSQVCFDVRLANIGGNIRAQPPKNLLEVVLDRFRHDTTPYCSW